MKGEVLIVSTCLSLAVAAQALEDGGESLSLEEEESGVSALFVEAEDFALTGGWTVREEPQFVRRGRVGRLWPWYKDISQAPRPASGLRFVSGAAGTAKRTFVLPHDGLWRVWVRHMRKGNVTVNGRRLTGISPEPGDWAWSFCALEAEKGPLEVFVTASGGNAAVDCVAVTDDERYVPDVRDFNRLFMRIRLDRRTTVPMTFSVGGRARPDDKTVKPGATTEWIDISKRFVYGATQEMIVTARAKGKSVEAHFDVDFSWDGSTVAGTFRHRGGNAVARGLVSLAARGLASDVELSAADLRRAQAVSTKPSRRPKRFGVSSTLALDRERWSHEAVENELEVFRILGLNGAGGGRLEADCSPDIPDTVGDAEFIWDLNGGCICAPKEAEIRRVAEKVAERNRRALAAGKKVAWSIMDEVCWGMDKVLSCTAGPRPCAERFGDYLKANGLKPQDFGAQDWAEVKPVKDYTAGLRYYWTARYRDHVLASFFETVTRLAREVHPNLCPTANMGIELVYEGNLLRGGMNLFELCNRGAMRLIQTEDWANLQRTYQHCSYQCDVLRAAGRRAKVEASMLNVISGRSDWEIAAKSFSEAGRGIKSICFFRYGPDYTGASDSANGDPRVYRGIRAFCDAVAPVEDCLMDGAPLIGDAALLLSVTGDRWQLLSGLNAYGKERMALSLMLNHLGVRTDILSEEDLADRLKEYRQLFVVDRNIRRACVRPLCDWLKAGGVMIAGPQALTADEANEPIDFGVFEKAGRVLRYDFSPRKDYLFAAQALDKTIYSKVTYPAGPRERLAERVAASGIVPAVKASDPLVEAQIVVSPHGRLLVLSNWRCEPVKVTITGTALAKPLEVALEYGLFQTLEPPR